jgi:hypothetical protein
LEGGAFPNPLSLNPSNVARGKARVTALDTPNCVTIEIWAGSLERQLLVRSGGPRAEFSASS